MTHFVNWSWLVLFFLSCFQLIAFFSIDNLIAVSTIIMAWCLVTKFILHKQLLINYPLSTFLLIGYGVTQIYFPLLFTSLENKPVIFNLTLPTQVFVHNILSLAVLISSHELYRFLSKNKKITASSLLSRMGFFKPPSHLQIWIMGILGLAASFYVYVTTPTYWSVTGTPLNKLIQAFIPFTYAPYFIPFGELYGSKLKMSKNTRTCLIIYIVITILMSIIRNNRSGFMIGFSSLGFAYLLGLLLGTYKAKIVTYKNVGLLLFSLWLCTGPIADLSTAMVIVRDKRRDISAERLLASTLNTFNDKKLIQRRRLEDNQLQYDWDERYLNNVLTARFCNLKYNDASLVIANKIGYNNPALQKFSVDNLWTTLPKPLLNAFNLKVDKQAVNEISFGDYMYFLSGQPEDFFISLRTGHFSGTGMATIGWWYLLLLGFGMIPVYLLFDKLAINRITTNQDSGIQSTQVCISFCGMLAIDSIFRFLPFESIVAIGIFLIRGWIQSIILYLLIFKLTSFFSKLLITTSKIRSGNKTKYLPQTKLFE